MCCSRDSVFHALQRTDLGTAAWNVAVSRHLFDGDAVQIPFAVNRGQEPLGRRAEEPMKVLVFNETTASRTAEVVQIW